MGRRDPAAQGEWGGREARRLDIIHVYDMHDTRARRKLVQVDNEVEEPGFDRPAMSRCTDRQLHYLHFHSSHHLLHPQRTMASSSITLVMGTAFMGPDHCTTPFTYDTPSKVNEILSAWYDLGGRRLDTARIYGSTDEFGGGGSERRLKDVKAGDKFVIDTKVGCVPTDEGARVDSGS